MNKKVALLTGFLALSVTSAQATPYLGGSLGYARYYNSNGIVGNLFAGNGSVFGPYDLIYIGGEAYLKLAHYSNYYSNMYGYGLSILPGIQATPTFLVYGRLGLNADFPNHNWKFATYGSHWGLGFQANISGSWDVRVEYVQFSTAETQNLNLGLVYKFG